MPAIRQLEPHVADLIAAGEVVERPASVVKELVENALDAGSSAVVVEIRRGGMGSIRVTDNGCGIPAEQLPTAFLRHATSKLQGAEDLGKIATLGFRGEALAAISAVSRIDIRTRRREDATGSALHLEGGVPGDAEAVGAPEGTTILVRDLFYNTPARLKFMKKDSAETAAVSGLMQHLALSHPDVSFKFLKDGAEALHTPGDGRLDSAIYAALGRDFARSLLPVKGQGEGTEVSGFITQPLQGRGSRSMQVFFVNGRFIKSQLLTAALEEGYRDQLMKGKFPGCVLAVTLPVTLVDVNVHPAKTQVKFAQERAVFNAVYHTVLDTLAERGGPRPAGETAPPPEAAANPRGDFFQFMDAKTYRTQGAGKPKPPSGDTERPSGTARLSDRVPGGFGVRPPEGERRVPDIRKSFPPQRNDAPPSVLSREAEGPAKEKPSPLARQASSENPSPPGGQAPPEEPAARRKELFPPKPPLEERPAPSAGVSSAGAAARSPAIPRKLPRQETLEPLEEPPWRIAGEVLRTYIVCESADGTVWLIDKHAAHERVNYDRLKAGLEPPMRQTLLTPAAVELGREDGALLLEHLPLLEELGFSCEDFGGGAVLVREVPADLEAGDVTATLEEIAGKLREGRSPAERRESLLHTMACKAAIKGGWNSDPAELRVLVEKVQRGEVRYCPHGRPVAVKITRYELEKMFRRA